MKNGTIPTIENLAASAAETADAVRKMVFDIDLLMNGMRALLRAAGVHAELESIDRQISSRERNAKASTPPVEIEQASVMIITLLILLAVILLGAAVGKPLGWIALGLAVLALLLMLVGPHRGPLW